MCWYIIIYTSPGYVIKWKKLGSEQLYIKILHKKEESHV